MRKLLIAAVLCTTTVAIAQTTTTPAPTPSPSPKSTGPVLVEPDRTDKGKEKEKEKVESSRASDMGFVTKVMRVRLLNEGGKRVVVDKLKHIPKGGECVIARNSAVMRTGKSGTNIVRVRYLGIQTASGGCPFLTEFEMTDADFAQAQAAFRERWK